MQSDEEEANLLEHGRHFVPVDEERAKGGAECVERTERADGLESWHRVTPSTVDKRERVQVGE